MRNITDEEFEDGTWVALILPSGKKAIGIIDDYVIQYASEGKRIGCVPIEEVQNIAEITIDWGEDT